MTNELDTPEYPPTAQKVSVSTARSIAVIPFRETGEDIEVLMITSRGKQRWIFPKGLADPRQPLKAIATEKALTEAGVQGWGSDSAIGTYRLTNKGASYLTEVFVLEVDRVLEDWEQSDRKREWLPLDQAVARIEDPQLKQLVESLPDFLTAAKLRQLLAALPVFNRPNP